MHNWLKVASLIKDQRNYQHTSATAGITWIFRVDGCFYIQLPRDFDTTIRDTKTNKRDSSSSRLERERALLKPRSRYPRGGRGHHQRPLFPRIFFLIRTVTQTWWWRRPWRSWHWPLRRWTHAGQTNALILEPIVRDPPTVPLMACDLWQFPRSVHIRNCETSLPLALYLIPPHLIANICVPFC